MKKSTISTIKFFGLFISLLLFFSSNSIAQNKSIYKGKQAKKINSNFSTVIISEEDYLNFIQFDENVSTSNPDFLTSVLKLSSEMDFELSSQDVVGDEGIQINRYQQTISGIPVMGADYILRSQNGLALSANGKYFNSNINSLNRSAGISEQNALEIALSNIGASSYMWEDEKNEEFIKKEQNDNNATFRPKVQLVYTSSNYLNNNPLKLAYQFDIYSNDPVSKIRIEIDANSGEIINKYSLLHHQTVSGSGITLYNGEQDINVMNNGGQYSLNDDLKGLGINTYDMQNGTNYGSAVLFTENDSFFDQEDNITGVSAHFGAAATYDYFFNNFGLNSFDGNGAAINSYVHYDFNYANAFWDGQRMTYGDGNGTSMTPLTSVDIVGHEIAHAVTQNSADLIYQYESGALNESFSDIFGQSIEFEAVPETASWNLADEIFTNGIDMIRSMSDPNSQGDPDTYQGDLWYTGAGDNGGVHINSGVQNYWYYLLVEGGSGTNDHGDNFTVPAIGLEKAQQIAFRNLYFYLTTNSQYVDARIGSEMAAADLYGEGSPEQDAVKAAWNAVGVPSVDPEILVDSSFNFGYALLQEQELIVPIQNTGIATLILEEFNIDNNNFTLPAAGIEIENGETYELVLQYNPQQIGLDEAELTISNNANDVTVNLSIQVVDEPVFSITPQLAELSVLSGNVAEQEYTITNDSDYELNFGFSSSYDVNTAANYAATGEMKTEGKTEVPEFQRSFNKLFANEEDISGGYEWTDSDAGVSYSWFEISSVGTAVSLTDDSNSQLLDMGMDFPFFEDTFSQVAICSNGWVSFTNTARDIWNQPLPSTNVPENIIAIMALDLLPNSGSCHYYFDETDQRFIIQYTDYALYSNGNARFTMQMQLYSNGKIKLLYDSLDQVRPATVGIQNSSKDKGITIAYDDVSFFKEGYAVEISSNINGNWLSLNESALSVPANSSSNFIAQVNTEGMIGGDYSAEIVAMLEDFQNVNDTLTVNLEVIGAPNLVFDDYSFGDAFTGQDEVSETYLKNLGTEILEITDIYFQTPSALFDFELSQTSIAPGDSALLTLSVAPVTAGLHSEVLVVESNDFETAIQEFNISVNVLDPPVINWSPSSISSNLLSNETEEHTISIDNTQGGSDLYVEVRTDNYTYDSGAEIIRSSIVPKDKGINPYENIEHNQDFSNFTKGEKKLRNDNSAGNARFFTMKTNQTSIFEYDVNTGELLNEIETGIRSDGPDGLAFDGTYLYYNNDFSSSFIFKVDASTGQKVDSIFIQSDLQIDGLAHSGINLYAQAHNQGVIYRVDFENSEFIAEFDQLDFLGGLTFGGSRNTLFSSAGGAIHEISLESGEIINSSPQLGISYGLGYSNAFGKIFVSNVDTGEILMIDPDDWAITTFLINISSYAIAGDEAMFESGANNWLSTNVTVDTIPAGETLNMIATIDSENLIGGDYTADIIISSNDPQNEEVIIPVSLGVTGIPSIETSVDSINFETVLVGREDVQTFSINNTGTDILEGTIAVEDASFSISENSFAIPAFSTQEFQLTFNSAEARDILSELIINSNASNGNNIGIDLQAKAVDYPQVSYSSSSLEFNLFSGMEATETLQITNNSNYPIDLALDRGIDENTGFQYEEVKGISQKVGKTEKPLFERTTRKEMSVETDVSGGYKWLDTQSGLNYNWYDIQAEGTPVSLGDDNNSNLIDLGFNFNFFEREFPSISIGSNGWLSFTNTSGVIWNSPLPSTSVPENVIAILANDLHPGQGTCHYFFDESNNRFIIQYTDWTYFGRTSEQLFTMQVQLYQNGDIVLLYDNIAEGQANGTVAIQNADKTQGLTANYNDPSQIHSGYGIKFSKAVNWLNLSSENLSIAPNTTSEVDVNVVTEGMNAGNYTANIFFSETSFGVELDSIPVSLTVNSASNFNISEEELDFGQVILGDSVTKDYSISNTGTDVLTVEITMEGQGFSSSAGTSFSIEPGNSISSDVIFEPSALGSSQGNIIFSTNDPTKEEVQIPLMGSGANPPKASISTDEIIVVMNEDEETSKNFNLANAVNSADLIYNISIGFETDNYSNISSPIPLGFYADINQEKSVSKMFHNYDFGSSSVNLSTNSSIILDTLDIIPQSTTGAVNVGGKIFTINYYSGELVRYNPENESIEQVFSIRDYPYGITFDGTTLWVGAQQSSVVIGYDLNGNEVGSFELPFPSDFISLGFDGEHILAAAALSTIEPEVYALNIDGSVNNVYPINSPNSINMTQFIYSNGNIWLLNEYNELNVLERYSVEEQEIVYVEEYSTGIPIYSYSLAQYRNELLAFPFSDYGYILEDGITGWLSAAPVSGVVEENVDSNIALNFNSTGLKLGTYRATVFVNTNDPDNSVMEVEAVLSIGNNPPNLIKDFENKQMNVNDPSVFLEFNLNEYFSDQETAVLSYTAQAKSEYPVVDVIIAENMMRIYSRRTGEAEIEVSASDGKISSKSSFKVTVGDPPTVIKEFEDHEMKIEEPDVFLEFDLNEHFSDEETAVLSYTAQAKSEYPVVDVIIAENMMRIYSKNTGETQIEVSAFNGKLTASTGFQVSVREEVLATKEDLKSLKLYPNPSKGIFIVESHDDLEFSILDMKGRTLQPEVIETDLGYSIDLQNTNSGIYIIKAIARDGSQFINTILKNE